MDPDIADQVDAYCDPDQDTPVRPRRNRDFRDSDWMWGEDTGLDPGPPAQGHEEPCCMCGRMLWTFADADAACRSCEQGWGDW